MNEIQEKHRATLREIAKFASGLVAADFLCGLWLYFSVLPPVSFFGIVFSQSAIILWMLFDLILLAFLVHYAWRMENRPRTDGERLFHNIAAVIFTLVALFHLSRIVFGWQLILGTWVVPYWINGLGTAATLFLAYFSFHLGRKQ